jgi:hypothetical protein
MRERLAELARALCQRVLVLLVEGVQRIPLRVELVAQRLEGAIGVSGVRGRGAARDTAPALCGDVGLVPRLARSFEPLLLLSKL